jgi:hypothetical protein
MKKILITGANSYIGTSFDYYIKKNFLHDYVVDTVDLIDESWREKSFAGYDSVFVSVANIVISLILVKIIGFYGVILETMIALLLFFVMVMVRFGVWHGNGRVVHYVAVDF